MSLSRLARSAVLALCITSVVLTAVPSANASCYSDPAALYKVAHEPMEGGDYKTAIKLMEGLTARFPFTEQARQAHLDLIYATTRTARASRPPTPPIPSSARTPSTRASTTPITSRGWWTSSARPMSSSAGFVRI